MSGLLSGLMLRRAGWDVDIYERVGGELSGRGAGIVAQPQLISHLRNLGLKTDALGVEISSRKVLDRAGRQTQTLEYPQVLTAWERVYRLLRDAFPLEHYHRGRGLTNVTQDARAVIAHFSDGETSEADVLVGADGIRSTVRQQCLPDTAPLYAGYSAWRAMIPESAFPADVHREMYGFMSFGLPPGEQFLGYPVAGPDNDLRPGMYLQVRFVFDQSVMPVMIPAAALATRSGAPRVAVLDGQSRVQYRTVQLGRDFGAEIAVLDGLKLGETVVIHPGDDIPEGAAVEPIPLPK